MTHASLLFVVAFGGALGAVTRFQVTHWFATQISSTFPYATLLVNVAGSFVIGLLAALLHYNLLSSPHWRPLVIIGFLGALTTFSTFSLDTFQFLLNEEWLKAILNTLLNVLLCIIAVACGYYLVRYLCIS